MAKRSILPALLLSFVLCGFVQDEWLLFSPDKKFSIEVPAEPVAKPEDAQAKKKGLTGKTWASRMRSEVYMISYMQLPESIPASRKDLRDQVFANTRQGLTRTQQAELKVTSDKPVTVGAFSGREFEAKGIRKEDSAPAFIKARTIIVQDRVYVIWVMSVSESPNTSHADRFFNSLKILKP